MPIGELEHDPPPGVASRAPDERVEVGRVVGDMAATRPRRLRASVGDVGPASGDRRQRRPTLGVMSAIASSMSACPSTATRPVQLGRSGKLVAPPPAPTSSTVPPAGERLVAHDGRGRRRSRGRRPPVGPPDEQLGREAERRLGRRIEDLGRDRPRLQVARPRHGGRCADRRPLRHDPERLPGVGAEHRWGATGRGAARRRSAAGSRRAAAEPPAPGSSTSSTSGRSLGGVEDLVHRADRRARHRRLLEGGEPVGGRTSSERRPRASRTSSSRCATRAWFVANRSSSAHSACPTTSQMRRNSRSLPPGHDERAIRRRGRPGTARCWGAPCRAPLGTSPPIKVFAAWFTIAATLASNSDTLTWRPTPVRSRSASAARMPIVACRPVTTSSSATPAFTGSPPGSPVTLIRPHIACTMMS